ncbi:PCS1 [Symbiodinium pilosum]|uniref:glutathione gamma-glutamylcysteinyltransferase n=1 Tax=Symbiodinium pilosum TaxID=2952 RepID=A0A812URE4_SYMPI|nr:PCS1 [Symbiodinium pilosum]
MYSYHSQTFSEVYRYWDSQNIWNGSASKCIKETTTPWQGSLEQIAGMLRCHGAEAASVEASKSDLDQFRQTLVQAFSSSQLRFVGLNFDRKVLGQIGAGHHSPIGAYDQQSDRVLVMDVARYKYPPFWAALKEVFQAMNSTEQEYFSTPRGYLVAWVPAASSATVVV